MRMFACHQCQTPLVERTAGTVGARSVSVGGAPYGDHICPLEDLGLLEHSQRVCPGLTPIAAQLGDWLVWADGRGRRYPVVRLAVRSGWRRAIRPWLDQGATMISKLVAGP